MYLVDMTVLLSLAPSFAKYPPVVFQLQNPL